MFQDEFRVKNYELTQRALENITSKRSLENKR